MPAPQLPDDRRIEHDLRPRFREADLEDLHKLSRMTRTPINVLARRLVLRQLRDVSGNLGSAVQASMPDESRDVYVKH